MYVIYNKFLQTHCLCYDYLFDFVCEKISTKNEFHLPSFIFWADVLHELNDFIDEYSILNEDDINKLSIELFSKNYNDLSQEGIIYMIL